MPSQSLEELFKALDKISEYNKLGGRGHGDLEDTCYICGISPSKLKELIQSALSVQDIESRMDEIATIPVDHGRLATLTYVNGNAQTIQSRYDELKALTSQQVEKNKPKEIKS